LLAASCERQLADLSAKMKRISGLDAAFPLKAGRGDEAKPGGSGLDSPQPKQPIIQPRDMYTPDFHTDKLKVKARDFR
jgi:hypothetical protein